MFCRTTNSSRPPRKQQYKREFIDLSVKMPDKGLEFNTILRLTDVGSLPLWTLRSELGSTYVNVLESVVVMAQRCECPNDHGILH